MVDRIEKQNIAIGKFAANNKDAIINLYYTPTVLNKSSLIFDKKKMTNWWQRGYNYAANKNIEVSKIKPDD